MPSRWRCNPLIPKQRATSHTQPVHDDTCFSSPKSVLKEGEIPGKKTSCEMSMFVLSDNLSPPTPCPPKTDVKSEVNFHEYIFF